MSNLSKILRILSISLAAFGISVVNGSMSETNGQTRDPFDKPSWAKPRNTSPSNPGTPKSSSSTTNVPAKPTGPVVVVPPAIQERINFFKRLREDAAVSGQELPKVTSVLTLDEMSVTGIFKTPRGYAAMVEAKPIKLSYTIYPGEKFFDGQLVAIEENRLVFRKITKLSNNKFVSSVENKTLRQYTVEQEVQGTAPIEPTPKIEEPTQTVLVPKDDQQTVVAPTVVISPLEEMNRQPVETEKTVKEKPGKKSKKPVKVADNKKQ